MCVEAEDDLPCPDRSDRVPAMPAKKRAARRGNPPTSDWYSTPNEKRNRPRIEFSLDPDTVERLERLASAEDRSKSAVIDDAVKQYDDRTKKK